jgi:hypothetical protein
MTQYPLVKAAMIAGSLAILLSRGTIAQERQWHEIQGKRLTEFDWNCASPSAYPHRRLDRVVQSARKRHYAGVAEWADRVFAFDLNGDRRREYFVPLVCGATGNCTWGVFSAGPARLLGIIDGQYLYVFKGTHRWPDLITYTHLNSAEGTLTTYKFGTRHYVSLKGGYHTDVSGLNGKTMPRFLRQARAACEQLGY